MSFFSEQTIYFLGALLSAGTAAVYDVREGRIPNLLCGPSIAIALAVHGWLDGWAALGFALLAGLLAGAVCLLFYAAGGMGAGDVKLMLAVGCWLGLRSLEGMLLATAFAGFVLGLAIALRRGALRQTLANVAAILSHHAQQGLVPHPEWNLGNPSTLRLPFAVPIATGCLVAGCARLWGG